MASKSTDAGSRSFNAMLVTNLSDEARKAVNEAFDAISNWRSETLSNSMLIPRAAEISSSNP